MIPEARHATAPFLEAYWRHRLELGGEGSAARRGLAGLRAANAGLRWVRAMRALPSADVALDDSPAGEALRSVLAHRAGPFEITRPGLAVLRLPDSIEAYLRGRRRQAVRTALNHAREHGLEVITPAEEAARWALVHGVLAEDRGATNPADWFARYSSGIWLGVVDGDGRALAVGIVLACGADAYLAVLVSAYGATTASEARFVVHTAMVERLIALGVDRLWADGPLTATPGVQHFQRVLGYDYARPRLLKASPLQAPLGPEPGMTARREDAGSLPSVTAVIPTIGRESLDAAIDSALVQTHPPREILVVFDTSEVPESFTVADPRVRALATGGGRGANAARHLGAEAASTEAVAFLDDDDRWLPTKLERQGRLYAEIEAEGRTPVIGARMRFVDDAGHDLGVLPHRLPSRDQDVADYLFKKRRVRWGEAVLASSMLMAPRRLVLAVPFDAGLALHQDWDWILRAGASDDVAVAMVAEPEVVYLRQAVGASASRSGRWRASMQWLESVRPRLTARQYGDFLLSATLPMAVDSGERRAARALLRRALTAGRPGVPALSFAVLLLAMPRPVTVALGRMTRWRR